MRAGVAVADEMLSAEPAADEPAVCDELPQLDDVSVLVVDDNVDSRNFLRELLSGHGAATIDRRVD